MKSILLGALALFVAVSLGNVCTVEAGTASGQVVTCPAGDPLPDAPVAIFINGAATDTVTADTNGNWSYDISGEDPGDILTAVFPNNLHSPYDEPYCPLGRHGTPPNCCEQVVGTIPSGGNLALDDLELRCGIPGAPNCPSPN
jgi:hypothetical protein